jgi:hypothetical protein
VYRLVREHEKVARTTPKAFPLEKIYEKNNLEGVKDIGPNESERIMPGGRWGY